MVDKAIQELEHELLKAGHSKAPVTNLQLQNSVNTLNSRIRNRGLSAKEILFQRDQQSLEQINIDDAVLATEQRQNRTYNHPFSAQSKASGKDYAMPSNFKVGDLVFIKSERDKNKARDRFIITSITGNSAHIQKLNDKFMARQYQGPLTAVYPISVQIPDLPVSQAISSEEDSEESEMEADAHHQIPIPTESASEPANTHPLTSILTVVASEPAPTPGPELPRHSTCRRELPTWMRRGDYELEEH